MRARIPGIAIAVTAAVAAVGLLLGACSTPESTRTGGLLPPPSAAPTSLAPADASSLTLRTMPVAAGDTSIAPVADSDLGDASVPQLAAPQDPATGNLGDAAATKASDSDSQDAHDEISVVGKAEREGDEERVHVRDRDGDGDGDRDGGSGGSGGGSSEASDESHTENAKNAENADGSDGHDDSSADDAAGTQAHAQQVIASADPPAGFDEGVLRVKRGETTQHWPVVIAATPDARSRGLMGVADFADLGGYAAMAFVFGNETTGAFWMRGTPLPLRITFVAIDATVVSWTDMVPCLAPTPSSDCPRYFADGSYVIAIEHPSAEAFGLNLDQARSIALEW